MTKLQASDIKAYANEAEALLKDYESPHHIWTAIRHVPEDGRREIFVAVTKELARRKKERGEEHSEIRAEIQRRFEEGARANEFHQRRILGKDF